MNLWTRKAAVGTATRRSKITIGLALGSGVARGWAHIGVLRALQEIGLRPDIVCGTSIGAVVGGSYLAEKLDAVEEWALSLSRVRLARYLDIQFGGGGLIAGRRLSGLLENNLHKLNIEELDRPLACVATELATGQEVWLQKGSLVDAIRASYALPGVFKPVEIDGRLLVDGALVNPVPVSTCRALGARLVIAVNLNTDTFGKARSYAHRQNGTLDTTTEPGNALEMAGKMTEVSADSELMHQLFSRDDSKPSPSMFGVMVNSLSIVQDRLSRSRLAGDPPDVVVAPRLGHIGLLEFHRAEECIAEGRASFARSLPFLKDSLAVLSSV
jgi:NTE family protein